MAFIEQESFTEADDITAEDQQSTSQETRTEQPQDSTQQDSVVDKVIPDKYKGKSVEDIVKMHQEAEKMIGRQAQEVHEVRSLADQLLKRQLEVDKKPEVVENTPEVDVTLLWMLSSCLQLLWVSWLVSLNSNSLSLSCRH